MYFVKKITMSGPKVELSSVDLDKGVNIFYGTSNTGKSYIAEAIDYMMGSEECRIDANKGYDTIRLELDVDGKQLILTRMLNSTKMNVISYVDYIVSGEYTISGNNRICHIWLKLMGISGTHRINKSAHFQREELSNRAFDQIFVIKENNIYSLESILLPSQVIRHSVAKSALLFLMTGEDFDDGVDYEKPDVQKAKRKAVIEFADSQLLELQNQENEIKSKEIEASPEELEKKISELLSEIDYTNSEINGILLKSKEIGCQIFELEDTIAQKQMLQNRYNALQSMYRSDLKRLTFMVEGEIRKKDFVSKETRKCPFCDNDLPEEKTPSCIDAATLEIEKLKPKMADLKSVQKSLKNEINYIEEERDELKSVMADLEKQVQQELQPKVNELRKSMADYAIALANHSSLAVLESAQNKIRDNLTEFKSKSETPKFTINEYFDDAFMERFHKIIDR